MSNAKEYKLQELTMLSISPVLRKIQRWWLRAGKPRSRPFKHPAGPPPTREGSDPGASAERDPELAPDFAPLRTAPSGYGKRLTGHNC